MPGTLFISVLMKLNRVVILFDLFQPVFWLFRRFSRQVVFSTHHYRTLLRHFMVELGRVTYTRRQELWNRWPIFAVNCGCRFRTHGRVGGKDKDVRNAIWTENGLFRKLEKGIFLLLLLVCEAFSLSEALALETEKQPGKPVATAPVADAVATGPDDSLLELVSLRERADSGDAKAQFELGRRYVQGAGFPQDDAEALRWIREAAGHGLARAQAGLGWMYAVGRGVARDERQSFVWYEKAAHQQFPVAQRMLGRYYETGFGVEKNPVLAKQWYEKAAAQGDKKAAKRLETGF